MDVNSQMNMEHFDEDESLDDSDLDRDYVPEDVRTSTSEAEADVGNQQMNRSRKRIRNESSWARNKAKKCRNSGGEYIGHRKVFKESKSVQQLAGHRYDCSSFSDEDHQQIFQDYWNLGSWNLQTAFLNSFMQTG
nr:uncharacterized protein LOC111418411 isoform X2 [Onthophagus taurus]